MPYTPPSQLSSAVSSPASPPLSRSHSYLKSQLHGLEHTQATVKPGLPRANSSSSYLLKHRRSPSISKADETTPSLVSSGESTGDRYDHRKVDPHGSLRQSPPPRNNAWIPTGATISPPDSTHNSSDEEEPKRGRERDLDNLAELQAAIRVIGQRKESSPTRNNHDSRRPTIALDCIVPQLDNSLSEPMNNSSTESSRPSLSREARKISHSRSSTDSHIVLDLGPQQQSPVPYGRVDDADEADSDELDGQTKPPMLRKKSGELVRPALRPPSAKRRPSSMPGTPTYSKAVHFDSHLEHVRHFLQVDKPLAVSANSSPVDNYESEMDFPFGFEWEICLSNFPPHVKQRESWPVRVERVFLSSDNKNLVGAIAVQNLAFQKLVVARFTLDYWKTTSEVVADFNRDVRQRPNDGCDRFNFSIRLADLANLENKTMIFCIRYNVNGQEYWDNNHGMNYHVDFSKKAKPQHSTNGMSGLGARPLASLPRTKASSLPPSFDDFALGFDSLLSYNQSSPASIIGDSPIKLKSPRPRPEIVPDAPTRRTKANTQAFGNRYDFVASLNAAMQNTSAPTRPEQSARKPSLDTKQPPSHRVPASGSGAATASISKVTQAAKSTPADSRSSKPAALVSGKPSLSSRSYQELVDKYCFFGSSAKPSPPLIKSAPATIDGANDDASVSDISGGSVESDSSDSSTPTPPRCSSPPSHDAARKLGYPDLSRSSSPIPRTGPGLGSRTNIPVSFGYPYLHQPSQNSMFSESPVLAAIHG